jgi:hypothetical protein
MALKTSNDDKIGRRATWARGHSVTALLYEIVPVGA